MSRIIKFRAWDEQAKVMHKDFRFIKSGDDGSDWIVFASHLQTLNSVPHPLENPYLQQQMKVMQFIGLLDINGVEIYESDFVSDHVGVGLVCYSEKHAAFRVIYGDGLAKWFYDYNLKGERESIAVIGNIHQNPELLNHG